ncbi:MAG TPA: UvrD-helicase domain-containing protein, partial [Acidimicrobiales bacterium]|nr:UvrD-helicase domain-containing protein [Acidimicrobiales bacterium]
MLWDLGTPDVEGRGTPVRPEHFDICGPLPPPGVTVLEASAGTGKTYTIAALVARMVAEGVVPLSEILVVTFTRMATGELRDRVRDRLVSAERGLGRFLEAGEKPSPGDEVLQLLVAGEREQVADRRRRLAAALAGFDAATITTTHGFCHTMLSALGVWGEVAAGAALLEDPTDLVEEVVDDLFIRHVLRSGRVPFRRKVALGAGLAAVTTLDAALDPPANRADDTPAGLLRRLGEGAREEVERRLVDANLLTYDDILVRLAHALGDGDGDGDGTGEGHDGGGRGVMACQRLRQRFRVVLVDEFQDTDPVQWQVVRRAFGDGATRLVLIGDPKQAVYSFRGADVYAYLDAARTADPRRRFTLERNWRSDAGLLAAYDALLRPLHLGHPEIVYRTADASRDHERPGLCGAPVPEPLRARLVLRNGRGISRTKLGNIQKDFAVKFVAADLARDVVSLLASAARLVTWSQDGRAELRSREISPGDIGVLVRTNRQATVVQAALRSVGVPVVVAGAISVFATQAARDWLRLLEALQQPASRSFAVAAALTPFIGMAPREVASVDERAWEELHGRLVSWGVLLQRSGVATLFGHIASEGLPARLLAEVDGERLLTDLGHIAELLHAEATQGQLGLAALRAWLARRIDEPTPEGAEAEQRSRRLDSGSDAVQVLTVHRAKGLEFPVVYCPYLWDPATLDRIGGPVVFHDAAEGDRRKLDVGGDKDDRVYMSHFRASKEEKRGEDLRHLYVALTRARNQTVIWWAGATECEQSALGRLLTARGPGGDVDPDGKASAAKDDRVEAELRRRAAQAPGLISVEHCDAALPGPGWEEGSDRPVGALYAASFDRHLDLGWRRSSYTSITAGAHTGERDGNGKV